MPLRIVDAEQRSDRRVIPMRLCRFAGPRSLQQLWDSHLPLLTLFFGRPEAGYGKNLEPRLARIFATIRAADSHFFGEKPKLLATEGGIGWRPRPNRRPNYGESQ